MNKYFNIKVIVILLLLLFQQKLYSQTLQGIIYEQLENNRKESLTGAAVYWLNTTVGTISDRNGKFEIPRIKDNSSLVISFIGYQNDTLEVDKNDNDIEIILSQAKKLNDVIIKSTEAVYVSSRPILTQNITTEGLRKAACCNLSESFESTLSVDVSYSDAVSGAKQIQMLGLAGIYTQIMLENTPYIRGLAAPFGLTYIPGSWMESINISKGTSSVINGYESTTGQIDVNYKKPETNKEKLFVNAYLNSMLKTELNINSRFAVRENSSTLFLFHFENQALKLDHNTTISWMFHLTPK
jgi:hypothetical protein